MDQQKERSRLEDDNTSTDLNRRESSQRSGEPKPDRNLTNTDSQHDKAGDDRTRDQNGGQQEGAHEKPIRKPMVNKGFD